MEKDRQMSLSTWATVSLTRTLHSCEAREIRACIDGGRRYEYAFACEYERNLFHICGVPVDALPRGAVDLSNCCGRFDSCKSAGNLCGGCVGASDVRYARAGGVL